MFSVVVNKNGTCRLFIIDEQMLTAYPEYPASNEMTTLSDPEYQWRIIEKLIASDTDRLTKIINQANEFIQNTDDDFQTKVHQLIEHEFKKDTH